MKYRNLGNTGLSLSEIGFGGEWIYQHTPDEVAALFRAAESEGINTLDCWMSDPEVRNKIGDAIKGRRDKWIIEGHIGSTWQDGQYARTRDIEKVKAAFEDLLARLQTDYIDLGMIHFVDEAQDLEQLLNSDFIEYVRDLKKSGVIRHIGMSSHNPAVAAQAVLSGEIELLLFSVNPAFDMLPASENIDDSFAEDYADGLCGIAPERERLYSLCEQRGVGINVMKGYAGGRLFSAQKSPFGVALSPVQCLHYALTRPAVTSVMVGFDTIDHIKAAVAYESASEAERDYSTLLANAPKHAYSMGQCTYCGHCAPCPSAIDIAQVNKYLDLATMQEEVPPTVKAHYEALGATASDCVFCGGCESRCPFGVRIMDRMEKARAVFGSEKR